VLSQVAVYREHLAELQHELAQGTLDQAGFDASHEELTQRLLEDAPSACWHQHLPKRRIGVAWSSCLTLAIPVLSFGLYFVVGNACGHRPAAGQSGWRG
jgi:cytochrome c-type biogenesis protein CcmI